MATGEVYTNLVDTSKVLKQFMSTKIPEASSNIVVNSKYSSGDVFPLNKVIRETNAFNLEVHLAFIELREAFEKVNQGKL